jgi:L-arabinose isomerase
MFAEMAGIEYVLIGADATVAQIKNELRWNEAYFSGVVR